MKPILLLVFLTLSVNCFAVPEIDSLAMAQKDFKSVYDNLTRIENNIDSYEEWNDERGEIDLVKEDLDRAKRKWEDKYREESKVWDVYITCFMKLKRLENMGDEFLKDKKLQQLCNSLNQYKSQLDSLLKVGQEYESRKEGDSVRHIKEETGQLWNEVKRLKAESSEEFENKDSLKKKYKDLNQKQEAISKLSEKTSPKIGDILLKVAIGLAAVAIIAGMVGSFIRGKKLRKGTDDTPTFEL